MRDPDRYLREERLESWPAPLLGGGDKSKFKPTHPDEFKTKLRSINEQFKDDDLSTLRLEEFYGARLYTGGCRAARA